MNAKGPRVPMPVTQVAKGIFKVGPLATGTRTPDTSPHVVIGQKLAIMEPGEDGQIPELLRAIREELHADPDNVAYIWASHIHLHHIAGINVLLKECPNAKVVVHRRGKPHLVEPTKLNAGTYAVWGDGCPTLNPVPEEKIWGCSGGEVLDLGGRELEVIEATGHAPHHTAVFDRLTKTMFVGDSCGVIAMNKERGRPDILPPLFDVKIQLATLERLRSYKPSMLLVFGYGGVSHSPDDTFRWAIDDVKMAEKIVLEGMQQKKTSKEIGSAVQDYYRSVGLAGRLEYADAEEGAIGAESFGGGMPSGSAPIGMVNYLLREHPDLEAPQ
jgi:glyoxylase-like metal-dependent hydrolase (beta-lactamase superfamily II)